MNVRSVNNCLMLSVNLEMCCVCDYPPYVWFGYEPLFKKTLSWEGTDCFPGGHHWEQADALPVYVSFPYESSHGFEQRNVSVLQNRS